MEIAYVTKPRPDTGLWNAKIAIWLFIASEVMLFGGLFSGYVFLRIGAPAGTWPHGIMDAKTGSINTMILIASSITAVFAWAGAKMRQFGQYKLWMGVTIALGLLFLTIKLGVEYPHKFEHFGAYIKQDALDKYEPQLGNKYLAAKGLQPRIEITGHLEEVKVNIVNADPALFQSMLAARHLTATPEEGGTVMMVKMNEDSKFTDLNAIMDVPGAITDPEEKDPAKIVRKADSIQVESYTIAMDPVNADPTNPDNDRAHFLLKEPTDKTVTIKASDTDFASYFVARHSPFLAIYFTITVLHALHIVGGLIVFIYFFLPFGSSLYKTNPEQFSNRIETSCIYWHFVDLVWMFAFPIFYLL